MCNGKDTPNSRNSQPALRETNFPSFKVAADMPWLKWIIKISAWRRAFITSMNERMNEFLSKWKNKSTGFPKHTVLKMCAVCKLTGQEKVFRWKWMDKKKDFFRNMSFLNHSPHKILLSVSFEQAHILRLSLICPITLLQLIIVFQPFTKTKLFNLNYIILASKWSKMFLFPPG